MKKEIRLLLVLLLFSHTVDAQTEVVKITKVSRYEQNIDSTYTAKLFKYYGIESMVESSDCDSVKRKLSFLFKDSKKMVINNNFCGRRYFNYYNKKYYLGGRNSDKEDYYLGMAIWSKNLRDDLVDRRNKSLLEASVDSVPSNSYDLKAIEARRETILDSYQDSIDEAHKLSVEYFFKYRNSRKLVMGVGKGKDKSLRTSMFYENNLEGKNDRFLSNYGLNFGQGGSPAVSTEVFKDYFPYIRASLSTVLNTSVTDSNTSDADDIKNQALQRLIGGGGNLVGKLSTPFFHYTDTREGVFRVFSTVNVKGSIDVPRLGTIENDVNWMVNPYFNIGLVYSGYNGDIALLGDVSVGYLYGGDSYFDYLFLKDDSSLRQKGMFMNKLEFGLAFGRAFRLTYGYLFGSDYWKSENVNQISITFVPE